MRSVFALEALVTPDRPLDPESEAAMLPGVADLAHPTRVNDAENLVRAATSANVERHRRRL